METSEFLHPIKKRQEKHLKHEKAKAAMEKDRRRPWDHGLWNRNAMGLGMVNKPCSRKNPLGKQISELEYDWIWKLVSGEPVRKWLLKQEKCAHWPGIWEWRCLTNINFQRSCDKSIQGSWDLARSVRPLKLFDDLDGFGSSRRPNKNTIEHAHAESIQISRDWTVVPEA